MWNKFSPGTRISAKFVWCGTYAKWGRIMTTSKGKITLILHIFSAPCTNFNLLKIFYPTFVKSRQFSLAIWDDFSDDHNNVIQEFINLIQVSYLVLHVLISILIKNSFYNCEQVVPYRHRCPLSFTLYFQ